MCPHERSWNADYCIVHAESSSFRPAHGWVYKRATHGNLDQYRGSSADTQLLRLRDRDYEFFDFLFCGHYMRRTAWSGSVLHRFNFLLSAQFRGVLWNDDLYNRCGQ